MIFNTVIAGGGSSASGWTDVSIEFLSVNSVGSSIYAITDGTLVYVTGSIPDDAQVIIPSEYPPSEVACGSMIDYSLNPGICTVSQGSQLIDVALSDGSVPEDINKFTIIYPIS